MIKIRSPASIWRQNDQKCWVTSQNIQNNAKLQIWSNYNESHQSDVKTIKTKLNYKSDQNPMTCTSKRSKMLSYVAKHSKQRKLQNRSNYNELHRLDVKTIKTKLNYKSDLNYKSVQNSMSCIDLTSKRSKNVELRRKTFKTTQNYKSRSKSNDLHRFDVKTIKTKLNFKSDLNYKSDQNPMTCIDLTSKR